MVRVNPRLNSVDVNEVELNRKLRHACPRIKRWKSRIDEADGDVHRMREQAINKSPVYVAVQRGSKNIQIRTRTKTKWWRKWIQEGKKYGHDDTFATPIHIPSDTYRYQKHVAFTKRSSQSSTQSSPRRSLPVSPVKTGIHSPIKVSVLKNEQYVRSPTKERVQRGVPLLTLTPVPLNQVLKRKAKMVGHVASIGKGRWVDQDSDKLVVPGKQVFQYDSSSETEDENHRREKMGAAIINRLITPPSPEVKLKRMASAKRRETPLSPARKMSPKKDVIDVSEEESESDSHLSPSSRRIRSKIRAAGQTSLMFSPSSKKGSPKHGTIDEENEDDGNYQRVKSAAIKKIRATGQVRAALSPHKSPCKSPDKSGKTSPTTPDDMKKKIRAIGRTSAALSPHRDQLNEDLMTDTDNELTNAINNVPTKETGGSGIGSLFRKIKTIARLSSVSKAPDASPSGISLLMTKMRFLVKLSPRKKTKSDTSEAEETTNEESETDTENKRKKKKKEKSIKSAKSGKSSKSGISVKSGKSRKSAKVGDTTTDDEQGIEGEIFPKQSCFSKVYQTLCPCIARKKEPEIMEYQSGSQAIE